jgi:hypothetical protein
LEALRAIASLANRGGGYLIVGFRERDGVACHSEGLTQDEATAIEKSLVDSAHEHIKERILDLMAGIREAGQKYLVIVRVPKTVNPPHMVMYLNNTIFVSRYHDGEKAMTFAEIKDRILNDVVRRENQELSAQVREILQGRESERDFARMKEKISENRPARLDSDRGKLVHQVSMKKFVNEAGSTPFFWIAATPLNAERNRVELDNPLIKQLIDNPPGTTRRRCYGWGMQFEHLDPMTTQEGLIRGRKDYRYYELLRNGHLELWVPMNEYFCWGQEAHEFVKQPRLRALIYTEFILCFLTFYCELMDIVKAVVEKSVVSILFHNLEGYALSYREWRPNGTKFPDRSFEIVAEPIANDFVPDLLAKQYVRWFHEGFGVNTGSVPYFNDQEQKFVFPL